MSSSHDEYSERETPFKQNGLKLDSISLRCFRNYRTYQLDDIGPLTILVGPNAVGKTSIIEAIQMMTSLHSFRTAQSTQMIMWNEKRAFVEAHIQGNQRYLEETLTIEPGKRIYRLNGKAKRMADLKGLLPAVTFCPDDLHLVKGSNSARRAALDDIGSQLSKNFYAVKSDYEKLVKQKNLALKEEATDLFIDSIDEVLVRVGVQLLAHRMTIVSKVQPLFQEFYRDVTGDAERVSLIYRPCWEKDGDEKKPYYFERDMALKAYEKALHDMRGQERARQRCVIGPHADEVGFLLQGRNAIHFASQGQQRTIALAFKLAEAALIQDTLNQKPILLLDDVMSELDDSRRLYFMEFISDDIQTFITTTHIDYFSDTIKQRAAITYLTGGES